MAAAHPIALQAAALRRARIDVEHNFVAELNVDVLAWLCHARSSCAHTLPERRVHGSVRSGGGNGGGGGGGSGVIGGVGLIIAGGDAAGVAGGGTRAKDVVVVVAVGM